MADHPTFGNGKICYIGIPAIDINVSSSFYQKVFNWNIRKQEDGSISFDDGVGEVSGTWVPGREPADQNGFFMSIMVDDILATIELIKQNGGEILDIHIEGNQKLATFTDPAGNMLSLYQHNR